MNARKVRQHKVQAFVDSLMTDDVLDEWIASYTETLLYGFDPHYDARIKRLVARALVPTSGLTK